MKRYHAIEYAASCLRNAKDDEQRVEILRELAAEGVPFIPFDPLLSERNWTAKEGKLIGGFQNLKGIGPAKAEMYLQRRESVGLSEADLAKLATFEVKNSDLREAHTRWQQYYDRPHLLNVNGSIKEVASLRDNENAVIICKLVNRVRRDRNETVLIARRGGERAVGQTLFLDANVVDDSVSKPITLRINERQWEAIGQPLADNAIDGRDWFLVRGVWWAEYSMMGVRKMKCLTNPDIVLS